MPPFDFKTNLLAPARKIISALLRTVPGDPAHDPEVRSQVLLLADMALVNQYPVARLIPPALRQSILRQVLDELIPPAEQSSSEEAIVAGEDQEPILPPSSSVQGFLADAETADIDAIATAAAVVLGPNWKVYRVDGTSATFHMTNEEAVLSVPEAWELAHILADQPKITSAEPVIEWTPAPPELGGWPENALALANLEARAPGPEDRPEWSLEAINVKEAWDVATSAGRPSQGEGIKIAHLDTGVTNHRELPALDSPLILLRAGANFYDPDRTAHLPLDPMDAGVADVLKTWFVPLNGHGTGTLSVLLSPPGHQGPASSDSSSKYVNGVAPKATVIPIRVAPTVVHWNLKRMIDAIRFAHQVGCHVFTMSMGGPPPAGRALAEVVEAAAEDGVIFCSAAGNIVGNQDWFPIVVWPAAMDQVIAVGGSNVNGRAWNGSSRGPEVNISAPAEHVWHAAGRKGALKPTDEPGTNSFPGNGTSFATPATAGLAACWLAFWGRDELIRHYGHPRYIPRAFAWLVRNVAYRTPPGWKTKLLGPGVIDGAKLLSSTLPEKAALLKWPKKKHALSSNLLAGIFKGIYFVTPGSNEAAAISQLPPVSEAVFDEDENSTLMVRRFGGELLYHFFDRPGLAQLLLQARPTYLEGLNVQGVTVTTKIDLPHDFARALGAVASPSLARQIAVSRHSGAMQYESETDLQQSRGNFGDDETAATEIGQKTKRKEPAQAQEAIARPWRVALSLKKLLRQVNQMAPRRNRSNDGTIGDKAHQSRASDHNPWVIDGDTGVVTALDITHDPNHGCDSGKIAEAIRTNRDPRVKYIIWNRRIAKHAPKSGAAAWAWRAYRGSNPHDKHCHISVLPKKNLYDAEKDWPI